MQCMACIHSSDHTLIRLYTEVSICTTYGCTASAAAPYTRITFEHRHAHAYISDHTPVYFPEGQDVHVAIAADEDPRGPYFPAAHCVPSGQDKVAPGSIEYLPAERPTLSSAPCGYIHSRVENSWHPVPRHSPHPHEL